MNPPISGFTTWEGEGHGLTFARASTSERVRGRVSRSMLVAVLPESRLGHLLETLQRDAPIQHMTYWVEDVAAFGQLLE